MSAKFPENLNLQQFRPSGSSKVDDFGINRKRMRVPISD